MGVVLLRKRWRFHSSSSSLNRSGGWALTSAVGLRHPTIGIGGKEMLYIVGLGLGNGKDITLRGLEAVKKFYQRLVTLMWPSLLLLILLGCKFLALCNDADVCRETMKRVDSSSIAIVLKVQEILVSCKELKSSVENDSGAGRPKLCPKWIALLTMEKACITTISLEETTGAVRKTGGDFKEKLRELGGLDAVFEVAMNCHSDMEV